MPAGRRPGGPRRVRGRLRARGGLRVRRRAPAVRARSRGSGAGHARRARPRGGGAAGGRRRAAGHSCERHLLRRHPRAVLGDGQPGRPPTAVHRRRRRPLGRRGVAALPRLPRAPARWARGGAGRRAAPARGRSDGVGPGGGARGRVRSRGTAPAQRRRHRRRRARGARRRRGRGDDAAPCTRPAAATRSTRASSPAAPSGTGRTPPRCRWSTRSLAASLRACTGSTRAPWLSRAPRRSSATVASCARRRRSPGSGWRTPPRWPAASSGSRSLPPARRCGWCIRWCARRWRRRWTPVSATRPIGPPHGSCTPRARRPAKSPHT